MSLALSRTAVGLTAGAQESVGVDAPVVGLPVVGNGLDQVTVGGAHANPEGSIAGRAARSLGEDKGGSGFTDEGVVGDRTGAEGRAHGSVGLERHGGEDGESLGDGRHSDGWQL